MDQGELVKPNTLYQAWNKVFCATFWNKKDAEDYISKTYVTSGFRLQELLVWGEKPTWLTDLVQAAKEVAKDYDPDGYHRGFSESIDRLKTFINNYEKEFGNDQQV
jgi:hypothetical protein